MPTERHHLNEPWLFVPARKNAKKLPGTVDILDCRYELVCANVEEISAARIVACVNALSGVLRPIAFPALLAEVAQLADLIPESLPELAGKYRALVGRETV